jgi:hypothetical protein
MDEVHLARTSFSSKSVPALSRCTSGGRCCVLRSYKSGFRALPLLARIVADNDAF